MNVREVPQPAVPAPVTSAGRGGGRFGIDPYLDWLNAEGIPLTEDYGVYLFDVPTAPWPRPRCGQSRVSTSGPVQRFDRRSVRSRQSKT